MRFILGLLAINLCALLLQSTSAAELPAKTTALCLAEVVSLEEINEMPADGNWTVTAKLKIVKATGAAALQFSLVKEYGGKRAPGMQSPPVSTLVAALAKGKKFWLAFSADKEVIAWWPQDAAASKELEAAIQADRFSGK